MAERKETRLARLMRGWRFYWALGAAARAVALVALLPVLSWAGGTALGYNGFAIGAPLTGFIDPPVAYSGKPFDRSFQAVVERRFAASTVWRPFLVRLNNELDYRLLSTSRMGGGATVIGRGDVLLGRAYVDDANNYGRVVPDAELEEMATDFARLDDMLRARGIAFAVVGSPSKLSLLPDAVPAAYPPFDPSRPRAYDRAAAKLIAAGVPFFDGRGSVIRHGTARGAMFPRGGVHWTKLAASAALAEPVAALTATATGRPASLLVEEVTHVPVAEGSDVDLSLFINRLYPDVLYGSDLIRVRIDGDPLPRPVIVFGSSFIEQMHWVLYAAGVAPDVQSVRYLSLFFRCSTCEPELLRKDWPALVEGASAMIVEMNETIFFMERYAESYPKRMIDRLMAELDPNGRS